MKNWIKLHPSHASVSEYLYVNTDNVTSITPRKDGSEVSFNDVGNYIFVKETPEQIIAMIKGNPYV